MSDVKVEVEHRDLPPDWERWRGSVDTKLEEVSSQLQGMNSSLASQLGRMEQGLNRQLGDMRLSLGEVEQQTKLTNGRVSGHDVKLAELATQEQTREKSEAKHDAQDERVTENRRYTRTTLLSCVGAAGGLVAATSGLLAAAHVI